MGNHRADVGTDSRPAVTPSSAYVGKRRAAPVVETPAETSPEAPYVGKRRAVAPVPPAPAIPQLTRDLHEATDARVTTNELRALVDLELTDTAPRPRVVDNEAFVAPQRRPAPDPMIPLGLPKPLFADERRIDLPRLSDAATTDLTVHLDALGLSSDTTTLLPAIDAGGRRASRQASPRSRSRRFPSLRIVVGAAALAISAGGVVATTDLHTVTEASGRPTGATALSGTSATGSVGTSTSVPARGAPLSRDSGRSEADQAAAQRAQALDKIDAQADGQDKYLHSNEWTLPISAGGYHLTGRFGDVSGLWATVHTGLDFACPEGTSIHAVSRGVITFAGWDGPYGNKTVETLPDGTEIWYAHQSDIQVSVGESIDEGQVIGLVGATGNVTGPHVHIEVRPGGGDPVDPDPAFRAHGVDPDADQ
jgi:murein DD-endopeptidase MepM/ murein hydrolase activator NlpD